ncbi:MULTISPECIES: 16S rRNA (cytidine(1402)-2'-O)-methyltransferase [Halomonadaceae]|uniref:Ribosomal RNA small subunit methyltransferase I n=1 Tax=Vreelandella piezotolerans TaxID=2609667 RepID=A0ABQ6XAY3_9GAMM|nr:MULTISPECIES: 16S rRNA (cytidine(1402)-2'-O)-methyltransferase [Halomonas]KAE8439164.1 16S rRNA (cytidine(1402)-2'-O)-methyltransferase [Halomonas piezotolerans]MCG7575586.1 16S rRNA (cytidine(1402)-2'-O)-methyltransferase [Halomonas sp. MMH1-48]MCG7589075.1 16S rRNA (cytidine(1402)-2'-O)-methyltransferase [Halomonas sp. McD50-5]MCG7602648.1 16S rRNA (cytidine(1402)-2'-O)-methyltransferase [Halomonas sp. MM17-34]MCG7611594.1 16S rRNA (cytidine(1402)-2'-O)-methyltransferase [Halomonas sp. MM
MTHQHPGTLYVVATPIGNLDDLTPRAARVLADVSRIAAEDTRHSARLLGHLGVNTPMMSLHEHNEAQRVDTLDGYLLAGENIALISDAGTPLICDPGFVLVRELRARGRSVVPLPGPCALITALSAAGLPTDRFTFGGFLPAKPSARRQTLEQWQCREETLVFYESPHRIVHTLEALCDQMPDRSVVLARELTKTYETFLQGSPASLRDRLADDPNQSRGEFVIMISGAPKMEPSDEQTMSADELLAALLAEGIGVKQGASVAARMLGGRKQEWYARLQAMKGQH